MLKLLFIISLLIISLKAQGPPGIKILAVAVNAKKNPVVTFQIDSDSTDPVYTDASVDFVNANGSGAKFDNVALNTPIEVDLGDNLRDYRGIVGVNAVASTASGQLSAPATAYFNVGPSDPSPNPTYPSLPCFNPCYNPCDLRRRC